MASCEIIIVYSDLDLGSKDVSFSGKRFAYALKQRLSKEGYEVLVTPCSLQGGEGSGLEVAFYRALGSAKAMIAIVASGEQFGSEEMANSWKSFLSYAQNGEDRLLIPVYHAEKGEAFPREFAGMPCQDASRRGAAQDIARGIKKVFPKKKSRLRSIRIGAILVSVYLALNACCIFAYWFLNSGDSPYYRMSLYEEAMAEDNSLEAVILLEVVEYYGGYEDSSDQLARIKRESLITPKVGGWVWLGKDKDGEDIVWRVLDNQGGKYLLLSEYGLACEAFSKDSAADANWDTSHLNEWLNNTFKKSSFSSAEAESLDGDLFCLSAEEASSYLRTDDDRICFPTVQAEIDHVAYDTNTSGCSWWLRSLAARDNCVAIVEGSGCICEEDGASPSRTDIAVRPAVWVSL